MTVGDGVPSNPLTSKLGDPMVGEQHYDVIVIGTGAGGGTLAHRLAPTGKKVLLLERGDYLPRERDNWDSTAVFVQGKYRAPEFWLDRHGDEFPPEVNYYVGRQHQVLRRGAVPAAPAGLRRVAPPRRHLARVADQLRGSRAVLHPGRAPVPGARRARRGPHRRRRRARRTASRPVEHEPRIQQLSDDLDKQGLHPFHLPIGVNLIQDAARRTPPTPASASAATGSTGSPAWSRPSPTPR